MSAPEPSTIFETAAALSSAVKAMPRATAKASGPHALSAAALAVAAQRFKDAYSPIVVAGIVRVVESALVAATGFALYVWSISPLVDSGRYYIGAIAGISLLSMLAFQAADIYQVQAFRGHEKQYMRLASAWSVVFLLAIATSYFTKSGDQFSRFWLGSFYAVGLVALIAFRRALFLLVRRWTRQGRLDRRTVIVGAG
ncbi:MAG: undecaprenyl-phosphate glucose phosphotransferase, partial [Xanthobacteraceae bacterium]